MNKRQRLPIRVRVPVKLDGKNKYMTLTSVTTDDNKIGDVKMRFSIGRSELQMYGQQLIMLYRGAVMARNKEIKSAELGIATEDMRPSKRYLQ